MQRSSAFPQMKG